MTEPGRIVQAVQRHQTKPGPKRQARARPSSTVIIGLSGISVPPDRLRALQPDKVLELAESIKQRGRLLQPIVVRPRNGADNGYWLVGGWHRLEAVRKLGHDCIEAKVLDGVDADAALLAEIDENLIRAELSPAERKLHIARRKELYDAQPSAPKRGGDRRSKSPKETLKSYVDDTAAKTGKGRSTVARDVTHTKQVVVLSDIARTSLRQRKRDTRPGQAA
jgi:hypothetical protein